jgi:hypothetical protein
MKLSKFIAIDDIFFKAKNKRTKSIEDYLKNFLNQLLELEKKEKFKVKFLKKGFGAAIVEKD